MRAVAGGRAFHLHHLRPRPPWRAPPPPPTTTASLLPRSAPASHPHHRRLAPGFLPALEPRISAICLGRQMYSGTCHVSLDGRLQGELDGAKGELQTQESVGAFQKIPMVMPATDILMSAQRKSRNVPPTKGIANIAKRERNKGAKQLDALMKELSVPLRTYTENFPKRKHLHPYERSLIELTFGEGYYEQVIGRVDALRKRITSVGKQHASVCAKILGFLLHPSVIPRINIRLPGYWESGNWEASYNVTRCSLALHRNGCCRGRAVRRLGGRRRRRGRRDSAGDDVLRACSLHRVPLRASARGSWRRRGRAPPRAMKPVRQTGWWLVESSAACHVSTISVRFSD